MTKDSLPTKASKAELVNADDKLVEKAYGKISDIFRNSFKEAIVEAGAYLIEEFFDNDYERARTLKQQLPEREKKTLNDDQLMKAESFFALTKKFTYGDVGSPSKSWLYNAVKLAVQDHDLKDTPEYELLNVSKRILLFPLKDSKTKTKYIPKIAPSEVTITKAKEILPPKKTSSRKGLPYFIKHPDLLFSKLFDKTITMESYEKIDEIKRKELIESANEKKLEIQALIAKQQELITNLDKFAEELTKERSSEVKDNVPDANNV